MDIQHNVVGWFEIPVLDMDRAVKFYQTVFGFDLSRTMFGPLELAMFPALDRGMGAAGALAHLPATYRPSPDGVVIYFTAFSGDVAVELSRVEAAGGKVLMPKKLISEDIGYMGLFLDPEGNRIALHSRE